MNIIKDHLDVHGTVFVDKPRDNLLPRFVHNHGILKGPELQQLLRESKVRLCGDNSQNDVYYWLVSLCIRGSIVPLEGARRGRLDCKYNYARLSHSLQYSSIDICLTLSIRMHSSIDIIILT